MNFLRTLKTQPLWLLVLGLLVGIEVLIVAGHGVNKLLGEGTVLEIDSESAIPAWFSAIQFFCAGAAGFAMAVVDGRRRWAWLILGLVFLGFSLDDIVQVHERTEAAEDQTSRFLIQPIVAAIAAGAMLWAGRGGLRITRVLLGLGATAVVIALGMSMYSARNDPAQIIIVATFIAEEWSEMLMASFVLGAVASAIPRFVELRLRAPVPGAALDEPPPAVEVERPAAGVPS